MRRLAVLLALGLSSGCGGGAPPDYEALAAGCRAEPLLTVAAAPAPNPFGSPPGDALVTASALLHLMRIEGVDAVVDLSGERVSALAILTSDEVSTRVLGGPTLIRTRTGVRYPSLNEHVGGAGDEGHRGLCLANLAEMGLSLETALEVGGARYRLRDVLRDTLAEFHEEQEELEWTATALARFLPPQDTWVNRFGMTCSLSSLTEELLSRPLWAASCGGTHRLIALSTLAGAHRLEPFLSPELEARVDASVAAAIEAALDTQGEDGSWSYAWLAPLLSEAERGGIHPDHSLLDRLLITGHLCEWLAVCERDARIDAALDRAAGWLAQALTEVDRELAWGAICPVTHAVVAAREHGSRAYPVAPFPEGDGAVSDTQHHSGASH